MSSWVDLEDRFVEYIDLLAEQWGTSREKALEEVIEIFAHGFGFSRLKDSRGHD
jgi:hypothetical protein